MIGFYQHLIRNLRHAEQTKEKSIEICWISHNPAVKFSLSPPEALLPPFPRSLQLYIYPIYAKRFHIRYEKSINLYANDSFRLGTMLLLIRIISFQQFAVDFFSIHMSSIEMIRQSHGNIPAVYN